MSTQDAQPATTGPIKPAKGKGSITTLPAGEARPATPPNVILPDDKPIDFNVEEIKRALVQASAPRSAHSPTPWKLILGGWIMDADGYSVGFVTGMSDSAPMEAVIANAELIVEAVNAYTTPVFSYPADSTPLEPATACDGCGGCVTISGHDGAASGAICTPETTGHVIGETDPVFYLHQTITATPDPAVIWRNRHADLLDDEIEFLTELTARLASQRRAMRAVTRPKATVGVLTILESYLSDLQHGIKERMEALKEAAIVNGSEG